MLVPVVGHVHVLGVLAFDDSLQGSSCFLLLGLMDALSPPFGVGDLFLAVMVMASPRHKTLLVG
jgi:hypothetical protein